MNKEDVNAQARYGFHSIWNVKQRTEGQFPQMSVPRKTRYKGTHGLRRGWKWKYALYRGNNYSFRVNR